MRTESGVSFTGIARIPSGSFLETNSLMYIICKEINKRSGLSGIDTVKGHICKYIKTVSEKPETSYSF